MRSIVKYMSIAVITVVLLSTLAMIPLTTSAQSIVVKNVITSRDAWGTLYKNMWVKVDINLDITSEIPGSTMSIILIYTPSGGSPTYYVVNASRVGTTLTYRLWLYVAANGTLYVDTDKNLANGYETVSPTIVLSDGDTVTISAYGKQDSLTFKAQSASITASATEILESAKDLNVTGWKISAPDLNFDPEALDNYTTITVNVYTESDPSTKVSDTVKINETDVNSGEFTVYGDIDISSLTLSADDYLIANFTIPMYKGASGSDVYYVAAKLSIVKVPTVTITTDRPDVPLSASTNPVDIKVKVVDKSTTASSVPLYVTVYMRNGTAANVVGLFVNTSVSTAYVFSNGTAKYMLSQVETSTYEGWIQINTSKLTNPIFINGWVLLNYSGSTKKLYLKVHPASLSVNVTSVKYGDVVEIKVVDPEMNLNASGVDSLNVSVDGANEKSIKLTETGSNTGIFIADIVIGQNITGVNPGGSFTISYTDERSPRTPGTANSFLTDTYSQTITIKEFVGTITTNKKVYGPYESITITITDPDANVNPTTNDTISADKILIVVAGNQFNPSSGAVETGPSTGVFELTLTPEDLYCGATGNTTVTDRIAMAQYLVKAGEIIVMYEDEHTPAGPKLIQTTFRFTSYDARFASPADGAAFNVGDKINITVVNPDANYDPDTIQSVTVHVASTTWPIGTDVTLYETGPDTGVFTGTIAISDSQVAPGYIYAKLGDEIKISYTDPLPADYATTGQSKTFTVTVHVGVTVEKPIKPQTVSFVNPMTGASMTPKVGKMVLVKVPLTNTAPYKVTFTAIMIVRDSSGAAVYIAATSIPLGANESGSVSFGWVPSSTGEYTIQVLILKSLAQWTPLGSSITTTVTVSS